jgi:hypothetical protein
MHDDDLRLGQAHALFRHAEHLEILAQRRKEGALHALELNAQHHDHVGVSYGGLDV